MTTLANVFSKSEVATQGQEAALFRSSLPLPGRQLHSMTP